MGYFPNIFTFQYYDWPWRNGSGISPILIIMAPLCPWLNSEIFRLWSMYSLHLLIDNYNALLADFPASPINCLATGQIYSCKTLDMHFARTSCSLLFNGTLPPSQPWLVGASWPFSYGSKPPSRFWSPLACFLAVLLQTCDFQGFIKSPKKTCLQLL